MAVNDISVGKDYTITIVESNGQVLEFDDLQNFKITANKDRVSSKPYNGPPRDGFVPAGYSFTFEYVRRNSKLEDYQLRENQRFEAGQHTRAMFLNEAVRNPDGTVSRYQYDGFVFWLNDIGDVTRERAVRMSGEGFASSKYPMA